MYQKECATAARQEDGATANRVVVTLQPWLGGEYALCVLGLNLSWGQVQRIQPNLVHRPNLGTSIGQRPFISTVVRALVGLV